ncbi:hypothetical protein Tco_0579655 [Tanacetum coccineum]
MGTFKDSFVNVFTMAFGTSPTLILFIILLNSHDQDGLRFLQPGGNFLDKNASRRLAIMKASQTLSLLQKFVLMIQDNPNQASVQVAYRAIPFSNPDEARAITTRSGVSYEGPSIPMPPPFVNPDVVEETSTEHVPPPLTQKVQETNSHPNNTKVNQEGIVNNPKTYELKLPYPERRNVEKRQEKDKVQLQKFWKMFKQLHFNISLADAMILMPKYTKMLKDLCANKEKLEELANPLTNSVD